MSPANLPWWGWMVASASLSSSQFLQLLKKEIRSISFHLVSSLTCSKLYKRSVAHMLLNPG
jgi:hypothetical protein